MSVDLIKAKFDNAAFNVEFNKYMEEEKEKQHQQEIERLNKMNETIYIKKISEMSFNELLVEWKNSIIGILDDLLHLRVTSIFSGNRLFFVGMTVVIIVLIFYFLLWFFDRNIEQQKIINEYHIFMKK